MTTQPTETPLTAEDLGLDFNSVPICECNPKVYTFRYTPSGYQVTGFRQTQPPCTDPADVIVTNHHVGTCQTRQQLLCYRHFKEFFLDRPGETCRACGTPKLIDYRSL
jgi:hypothetical protein